MVKAAGEERAAGDQTQHLCGGAGKCAVTADVTGKGGCVEGLALKRQPVLCQHPGHETLIRGDGGCGEVVFVLTGPGSHGDLADEIRAELGDTGAEVEDVAMLAADGSGGAGDDLAHVGHERQTFRVIRLAAHLRGLAFAGHVADHRDGSRAGVVSLQSPRGAGGIVGGGGEGEIDLHIPLEVVHDGSSATNALHGGRHVSHLIRQQMPVAGRRLGVRTIRPIFSEHAGVVAALHLVRRIDATGDGVGGKAGATVAAERVVAEGTGGNVHERGVIELAAGDEHPERLLLVFIVSSAGGTAETKLRGAAKGIEPGLRGIRPREAEGRGGETLHPEEALRPAGKEEAILRDARGEVERLPVVRIRVGGNAKAERAVQVKAGVLTEHRQREVRCQIGIDALRVGLGVTGQHKAVIHRPVQHGLAKPFAEFRRRRGGGDFRLARGGRVAERGELRIEVIPQRGGGETLPQHPIRRVADRLVPCRFDVAGQREDLFVLQVADGGGIVGRPGVVHGRGHVEKISRMLRRVRNGLPDGTEELLVPFPRGAERMQTSRGGQKSQHEHAGEWRTQIHRWREFSN